MQLLFLTAMIWLAVVIGLSTASLRAEMDSFLGGGATERLFVPLSVAAFVLFGYAYHISNTDQLWEPAPLLGALVDVATLCAVVLFATSVDTLLNPTDKSRGVYRIARHPMLGGLGLWSAAHLLTAGDSASLLFFGTNVLLVLIVTPTLDAELAQRDPDAAASLKRTTSNLPFAAILAGRNRLSFEEISPVWPGIGIVAWLAMRMMHGPGMFH